MRRSISDIGFEIAVDDVREALRPLELQFELAAYEAGGPIGRHQRGAADDGRCAALAIDHLQCGLVVRVGAAAHQSRRFNREADVDESGSANGVQQDFFDQFLRGHDGLAGTDARSRTLEALRVDPAELLADRG
jgi:hypothetical protein